MGHEGEEEAIPLPHSQTRHIKKRTLKNKSVSVAFNEKDLRDYVTGFHKRKKKRRKEAEKQQEEAKRRKRIELRKKRKLERELVYGGGPQGDDRSPVDENNEDHQEDGDEEPIATISGTTTYDNGDMKVTVTTSEISREEEILSSEKKTQGAADQLLPRVKKNNLTINKKKPIKKVAKHKSRPNLHAKRDGKNGKKKNKRH